MVSDKYIGEKITIITQECCIRFIMTVCYYHVTYEFQSELTLYSVPECQGTPCSKQALYLKFESATRFEPTTRYID